jgi:lipopolysaccharide export system permease protein
MFRAVIIDRYLSLEILRPFGLGLGLLVLVFVGFSAASQLTLAAEGRLELLTAARLVGLNTLVTLEILLPSAMFFSVLAALGRLYNEAEMDAMHAAGISRLRVMESVFKLSLVVATVTGLISIEGRPWAFRESYRIEAQAAAEFDLKKMATGEFVTLGTGDYVFIADDLDVDAGQHQRVFLQKENADGSRSELIFAASAELPTLNLESEMTARFYNGVNYSLDNREQRDITLEFEQLSIRLPAFEARERYRRRAQSTSSLSASTDPKDIAEYQWRLTTPLATILLALIAVPLARSRPRETRTRGFLLAMAAYLLLFSVSSITRTAVEEGQIPPMPGIWTAYLFFALFLLLLMNPPRLPRLRRS